MTIASGVTAAALWDYLKSLPARDTWELGELSRDEALRVAKSEIARAFHLDHGAVTDPVSEVKVDKHTWQLEIHKIDRRFEVEVAAAHTGTRARPEISGPGG